MYKDASGATPIVKAVKEAEKRLLESETTKNYLTIDGVADYNEQTQILLFGKDHEIIASRRAKTAQSLGGTGALRIAAEFVKRQLNAQTIWISNPTWPNHNAIAKAVGIQDKPYRYYDAAKHGLDWDGMIEDLTKRKKAISSCCTVAATTLPASTLRPNNGKLWQNFLPKKAGCHCLTLPTKLR